ncbi:MAG: 2-oxoacid:acceptor oxidoreductase family protein [Nitrospirae bacterium]|nr:2-oxoacid:acceptor oxidoreductase family protein [Nitrospirota bacterium]
MFQIRIHGRGGQGVVTAAEILAIAAFLDGKYAQAFPSFGSERMGAPVTSFCRIDDKTIRLREPVMEPDALIIQDPTLLHQVDLFAGIRPSGYILINSARSLEKLGIGELLSRFPNGHFRTVPASEIALETTGRSLPNAALVGGLAAMTRLLGSAVVSEAIRKKFPGKVGEANAAAAAATFEVVTSGRPWHAKEKSHAGTD